MYNLTYWSGPFSHVSEIDAAEFADFVDYADVAADVTYYQNLSRSISVFVRSTKKSRRTAENGFAVVIIIN